MNDEEHLMSSAVPGRRKVRSQEELNAAIADGVATIYVDSPPDVWLMIAHQLRSNIIVIGSSKIVSVGAGLGPCRGVGLGPYRGAGLGPYRGAGLGHVEARDSAHIVEARDSAHIEAWDSASVEARDSAISRRGTRSASWRGDSVHVEARDSAHIVACDSAHIEARDSARVEARGSAHIVARDSVHVEAWDSVHVVARDSVHIVEARDSVHIEASAHVAIHRVSPLVTARGGVVIDIASLDLTDPATWADYEGVNVRDGVAVVYKATSPELMAGQGNTPTHYAIGSTVVAGDWDPGPWCGNGLHFSPHPRLAAEYYQGHEPRDQVRYLACEIDITDAVPLGDKIKSESCRVLHEVDINGAPIGGAA
jgi:hypothetical protein